MAGDHAKGGRDRAAVPLWQMTKKQPADKNEPLAVQAGDGPYAHYSLRRSEWGTPVLWIDGIQMQATSLGDPLAQAAAIATAVVRPGDVVLDTCSGLGYTAMAARRAGAARVITVEVDAAVRSIRRLSPLSVGLDDPAIEQVAGDVREVAAALAQGAIGAVIHDPPRFSRAGELYGFAFYCEIFRLLASGGRLFHYTGDPGGKKGRDLPRGVRRRLGQAGFASVRPRPDLQGLTARRP